MTLCVDSSCSEEYKDQAKIISANKALAVAFLISYESGSFGLRGSGRTLVIETFREILQGSGLFADYEFQKIVEIEVNGHSDLEESKSGTRYDRSGGSCRAQALPSDSNDCLSLLRATTVSDLLSSTITTTFGPDDSRLENLVTSWHESPFLAEEEARFPGFLKKIGADSDRKQLETLLSLPRGWEKSPRIRQSFSGRVSGAQLWKSRRLMQKFRSVIVVIRFQ